MRVEAMRLWKLLGGYVSKIETLRQINPADSIQAKKNRKLPRSGNFDCSLEKR